MSIGTESDFGYPCDYTPRPITEEFKKKLFSFEKIQALDYYEFGANACRLRHPNVFIYCNENIPYNPLFQGHALDNKNIILKNARHFVAVSTSVRDALLEEGVEYNKISVIPFWVTSRKYKELHMTKIELLHQFRSRFDYDLPILPLKSDFIVLFVGRICRAKGLEYLVKACTNLEIKLICVGPKEDDVFLPDWVIYFPEASEDELLLFYNLADILVLPSISTSNWKEQFGRVLVESMACGTPQIATDVGGPRDIVQPWRTGFLVPEKDVWSLREAIMYLSKHPGVLKWFSKQSLVVYKEKFWPDKVEKQLMECFDKYSVEIDNG